MAYFQQSGKTLGEFSDSLAPVQMEENASSNQLSFSEFKMTGFDSSIASTIRNEGKKNILIFK